MTVRIPQTLSNGSSEVWAIDFREKAPASATEAMFVNNSSAAQLGGLAIAVPGELKGLEEVHRIWGRISWGKLVLPVADLARGWTVDRELARRIHDPVSS
jgi:gamma-glutamyltranspeptidase / glutathione hydrolase / leukotriene-C4 hydrolase